MTATLSVRQGVGYMLFAAEFKLLS